VIRTLLAALLLALATVAAPPAQEVSGSWITHLYMNDIRDLAVAADGIWCATGGGALFYDFETGEFRDWTRSAEGLASDTLTAVSILADGRVAFGTSASGLSIYDPDRGLWFNYTALTWPIAGDEILTIREDDPWRIIGSRGGFVAFYEGEVRETCQEGLDICGVPGWEISAGIEYHGSLWLGALPAAGAGGVARLAYASTGMWETVSEGLFSREIIEFAAWEESLLCADRGGVSVWNGTQWEGRRDGLPAGTEVRDLHAGPRNLLLATSGIGAGVFRWNAAERFWERFGTMHAQCIAEDADGVIWVGTGMTRTGLHWLGEGADGLWEYVGGTWLQHRRHGPHPLGNYRALTVAADGCVWAALAARIKGWKIARLDGRGWSFFDETNSALSDTWVLDLQVQDGQVWVGHCCCSSPSDSCYLNQWDAATGAVAVYDSVFNVYDSVTDAHGNLWFASWYEGSAPVAQGLYHLDRQTGQVSNYTTESTAGRLRANKVSALALDGRELWIGYQSEGVTRCMLDEQGLPYLADWAWVSYGAESPGNPLPSNGVRAVAARDGEIWIGTIAGVALYRQASWRTFPPGPFTLPGSEVTDIAVTRDGAAWAAIRGAGVTRIYRDVAGSYHLQSFAPPELVSPDATVLAVDTDGRGLWVGTERGLSHFIPGAIGGARTGSELHVYPNPYNPRCGLPLRLARSPGRAARGTIVDLSGAIVGRFEEKWQGDAIWDGRDEDGAWVAPGLYVIRANTPGGWLTGQVAVLDLPCDPY